MSRRSAGGALPGLLRRFLLEISLGGLVFLLFADYLFSEKLLYGSDSMPGGLFFRGLLVDFVREFRELPRWNPYILGGLPFLDATHGDTFFPSSILHFLMPVYRGMGHKLVLHVFLAGVFAAYWLRTLRLRPAAVALGSLAYMLSPIFVSYLYAGQDGKMYVASLAPLALGLLENAMRRGSARSFVALGLALGVTILSAQIQMAYHLTWVLAALFAVRLVGGPAPDRDAARGGAAARPGRVRLFVLFAASGAIGLLVAAIQLFPAVAYVKHPAAFSVRSERTGYEHASSWSLHPEEVASMVVPEFCNSPDGYWGRNPFKLNSDYPGILVLFLAALAMRRRDATRWFLAGLAAFAILYSLGGHTPLHRLFYWVVPQVKLFRAPPLVMFGAALGFAGLAACAVHDLETGPHGKRASKLAKRVLASGLGVAAAIALAGLAAGAVAAAWNGLFAPGLDAAKRATQEANLPAFRTGALVVAGVLAAGAGLVSARLRGSLAARPFLAALLVLALFDLWRIDTRFKLLLDPAPFTRPSPLLAAIRDDARREKFRVMPTVRGTTANELGYFGIESTLGFHDNELAWYREFRTAPAAEGLGATNGSGYPFLRVLNAKWLLHDSPDHPNPLEVAGWLPRFRLAEDWEVLDRAAMPARIASDDHDPARTVLLEEDPGFPPRPDAFDPPGRVTGYEYRGNRIGVQVEAQRPCLLVHAENWFPYWHARAAGRELPILRAYGTLRAIPLPAGSHSIKLGYVSRPYRAGRAITLVTVGAIAIFLVASARRGRRP